MRGFICRNYFLGGGLFEGGGYSKMGLNRGFTVPR